MRGAARVAVELGRKTLGATLGAPRSPTLPMASLRRDPDAKPGLRGLATRTGRTTTSAPDTAWRGGADSTRGGGGGVGSSLKRASKHAWRAYLDALAARPVTVKAATCFVGEMSLGEGRMGLAGGRQPPDRCPPCRKTPRIPSPFPPFPPPF
jgi:hypothetical protein